MGALDDELAILKARLITDTGDRLTTAKRRIADVEAAIAAQPVEEVETVEAPETTSADMSDVETAAMPKAKRR